MQHSKIIFITHDALHRNYLPTYGNSYWKTPNIDALAKKGTIFQKYYTGAPSTIMSNMCMFTGLEAYQSELSDYGYTHKRYQGTTLFDHANPLVIPVISSGMKLGILLLIQLIFIIATEKTPDFIF